MDIRTWRGALAPAAILLCLVDVSANGEEAPAVSAPNAKIEFSAGALNLPGPAFFARAAGTVTLPVGERFGVQADLSASTAPGFVTSGALHLFARDPAAYLIGGTFGLVRSPGATVLAAGPEAELYFDRWTVEAWGGAAAVLPTGRGAPSRVAPFIMTDVAYYPTDNLRLSAGLSRLDSYGALQLRAEYLFEGLSMPMSLTGELRIGQDGAARFMSGLRMYVGPDPHKSLLRRHREDDPSDRGVGLYAAASGAMLLTSDSGVGVNPGTPPRRPTPSWCVGLNYEWDGYHCFLSGFQIPDLPNAD